MWHKILSLGGVFGVVLISFKMMALFFPLSSHLVWWCGPIIMLALALLTIELAKNFVDYDEGFVLVGRIFILAGLSCTVVLFSLSFLWPIDVHSLLFWGSDLIIAEGLVIEHLPKR